MRNYFLCYLNISLFISISPHLRVNLILSGTLPIFPCCVCSACAIVDAQHTSVEWISSQSEFRYVVDGLQIWVVFLIIFVHSSCEYFITWSNVLFGNCSVSFSENITSVATWPCCQSKPCSFCSHSNFRKTIKCQS